MAKTLITEPKELQEKINRLDKVKDIKVEHSEARAEAYFRLALHPDTPSQEAIANLKNAIRIDSANPKYPYHVARLYLLHGELEQAENWLRKSIVLCPTSHRLWIHISILQRVVYEERFIERDGYNKKDFIDRIDAILTKIKEGESQFSSKDLTFKPEPAERAKPKAKQESKASDDNEQENPSNDHDTFDFSKVERMDRNSKCRWSGVLDVEIENRLNGAISKKNLQSIFDNIDKMKDFKETRPYWDTSFLIVCIECLLAGYPVNQIRTLFEEFKGQIDKEISNILDIICACYENEINKVPQILSVSLKEKQIPHILAALIHFKRVLWRPIEFEEKEIFQWAQELMDDVIEDQVSDEEKQKRLTTIDIYFKKLVSAIKKLHAPPPDPFKDMNKSSVQMVEIDAKNAEEVINRIEILGQKLTTLRKNIFEYTKMTLEPLAKEIQDDESFSKVLCGREMIAKIVIQCDEVSKKALTLINHVKKQTEEKIGAQELGDDFAERVEKCGKEYKTKFAFDRVIPRIENHIKKAEDNYNRLDLEPVEELRDYLNESGKILSDIENCMTGGNGERINDLGDLENEYKHLNEQYENCWIKVKKIVPTSQKRELGEEELNTCREIQLFIDNDYRQRVEQGINTLDKIKKMALQNIDPTKTESLKNKYIDLKNHIKSFEKKFELVSLPMVEDSNNNKQDSIIDEKLRKITAKGEDGLKQVLLLAEKEIDGLVTKATKSFNAYSDEDRNHTIFQSLECMIMSDAAALYYRLGLYEKATELWNQILGIDLLNIPALNNLAVAATIHSNHHSNILLSWKYYCEALYFYAVAAGDPTEKSPERSCLHRNFASAYTVGYIVENQERRRDDEEVQRLFLSFISSSNCLKEFMHHKLAEMLNRKLDFKVPTLVLGVDRSTSIEKREKAYHQIKEFVDMVCKELPERIRGSFKKICLDYIDQSFEDSKDIEGLVLKKHAKYEDEKKKQLEWLQDIYQLKYQMYDGIEKLTTEKKDKKRAKIEGWVRKIRHIDFIFILDKLNQIPADLDISLREGAVANLKLGEPSLLIELFDGFLDPVVFDVLVYPLNRNEDQFEKEREFCFRLFTQIVKSFSKYRDFWERFIDKIIKNIDDENEQAAYLKQLIEAYDKPMKFYPEKVRLAITNGKDFDKAVDALEEWCDLYPEITGPAYHLSYFLERLERSEEAIPYLEQAVKMGFWEEGVKQCKERLSELKVGTEINHLIEKNDYEGALKLVRKELKEEGDSREHVNLIIKIYNKWIASKPDSVKDQITNIARDFDLCLKKLSPEAEESDKNAIIKQKHSILTNASIAHLGELNTADKFKKSNKAMEAILQMDDTNFLAMYYLTNGLMQVGVDHAREQSFDQAESALRKADLYTQQIISNCKDNEILEAIQNLKNQLDLIKEKIGLD